MFTKTALLRFMIISAFFVLAACFVLGVPRALITRADLAISAQEPGAVCITTPLKVYMKPIDHRVVSANAYLEFAVASLNAYGHDGMPGGFTLARHSPQWGKLKTVKNGSGLSFDVYLKDGPELLSVLIAFRGSDTYDTGDWQANLAWFSAWLPIRNQYDDAREAFIEIRRMAYLLAHGRKVTFFATGHSLGGGIAQHIAYAFPCVSAPIFNASFVVLKYRLAEPFTGVPIVHIYEDLELVTRLRRLLFVDRETMYYRHYRVKAVDMRMFSHSMAGLAVGIARNVVTCQRVSSCMVARDDLRARRLYCPTFGAEDPACAGSGETL